MDALELTSFLCSIRNIACYVSGDPNAYRLAKRGPQFRVWIWLLSDRAYIGTPEKIIEEAMEDLTAKMN
jgi:hypothetical protein